MGNFLAQGAEMAAGIRQQLEADTARLGGLRLLQVQVMVIAQALGVQAGRGAARRPRLRCETLSSRPRSRLMAQALAQHGVQRRNGGGGGAGLWAQAHLRSPI